MSIFDFFKPKSEKSDVEEIIDTYGYSMSIAFFADLARSSFEESQIETQLARFIANEMSCAQDGDEYAISFAKKILASEEYHYILEYMDKDQLTPTYDAEDVLNEMFTLRSVLVKYGSKLRCDIVDRLLKLEYQISQTKKSDGRISMDFTLLMQYKNEGLYQVSQMTQEILAKYPRIKDIAIKALIAGKRI